MELISNPFSDAIVYYRDFSQVKEYLTKPATLLPGLILGFLHALILFVAIILWPYGWTFVLLDLLWLQIIDTVGYFNDTSSGSEKIAFSLSIIIYGLIFLPIFLICLPGFTVFVVGYLISAIFNNPIEVGAIIGVIIVALIAIGLIGGVIWFIVVAVEFVVGYWLCICAAIVGVLALMGLGSSSSS